MLSYMSVDRVEGDFVVCEVENIPMLDANLVDFLDKPCFMADVPKAMFIAKGMSPKEGQIYTVIHNGEKVDSVCGIDEKERKRRMEILEELF